MENMDNLEINIRNYQKPNQRFDPSTLNDEIALKTGWKPIKSGGANFQTHRINNKNTFHLKIQPSKIALLLPAIFISVSVAMIYYVLFIQKDKLSDVSTILPLLIGCIFFIVGSVYLYFISVPQVFDKSVGYYWKGIVNPNKVQKAKINCRLVDIHAVQVIREFIRDKSSSGSGRTYYSYEINLVLKNGDRLNVIDHGAKKKIFEQAKNLSQFLNVPLWNAVEF